MKKLSVEVTQVSNKDKSIISQSNIKIRVNGKFIENDIVKIIDNSIDKNKSVTYKIYIYYGKVYIDIKYKSGVTKEYKLGISQIDPSSSIKSIKNKLETLRDFIMQVENEVAEAHKYTNNYLIEIN